MAILSNGVSAALVQFTSGSTGARSATIHFQYLVA
jgi:hypothetical protein